MCVQMPTPLLTISGQELNFKGELKSWQLMSWLGLLILYLTSPLGGGSSIYKTAARRWFTVLSVALEEELKILGSVKWLNYYYFVCLTAFLCFCIFSLLWLNLLYDYSFFAVKTSGVRHGGEGPWGPVLFHDLFIHSTSIYWVSM